MVTKRKSRHTACATLREYFSQGGTSQLTVAAQLGISRSYLSMLASGQRQPALGLALKIEALTGVPAEALVQRGKVAA